VLIESLTALLLLLLPLLRTPTRSGHVIVVVVVVVVVVLKLSHALSPLVRRTRPLLAARAESTGRSIMRPLRRCQSSARLHSLHAA
jgi:hypothetical protein